MTDEPDEQDDEQLPIVGVVGPRRARVCPSDGCIWRDFGDPKAVCPSHGKGMDQPDRTYHGTKPLTKEAPQ